MEEVLKHLFEWQSNYRRIDNMLDFRLYARSGVSDAVEGVKHNRAI